MAAGLGFKTFTTGEVLTAADVNGYLMQGILVFANAAARSSAITSPQEGQYSFLKDTNALEYYDGAAWVGAPVGDITAVNAGTGITGGGASGSVTITNDMATTITAAGDIVIGTGNATYDNLPIGTTGQVLTADTTVSPYKVKWAGATITLSDWTPTYSNITVGNGTAVAKYADFGNFVWVYFSLTLGSTSSIGTNASLTAFPVSLALDGGSVNAYQNGATGKAIDASAGLDYLMLAQITGATSFSWWSLDAASTYVRNTSRITGTVPFTWAVSDELSLSIMARKA